MPARFSQGLKEDPRSGTIDPDDAVERAAAELVRPRPLTIVILLLGLWLFGVGEAALINAELGNTPWTVFAQGIADHSRLDIGGATILVGVLCSSAGSRSASGRASARSRTWSSSACARCDAVRVPHPGSLLPRILEAAAGIVIVGIGSAFYLTANSAGPARRLDDGHPPPLRLPDRVGARGDRSERALASASRSEEPSASRRSRSRSSSGIASR